MILMLWSCTYSVHIATRPTPALISLPDGTRIVSPADTRLKWSPLKRQTLTVSAQGHRPITVNIRDLRLRSGRALSGQKGDLELILVPQHGSSGTWTEDDVKR